MTTLGEKAPELLHPPTMRLDVGPHEYLATVFPEPNGGAVAWRSDGADGVRQYRSKEEMLESLSPDSLLKNSLKNGFDAFVMHRTEDAKGRSGCGIPAVGVSFPNGICVMGWTTEPNSVAVYDSLTDLRDLHGHGGRTTVEFANGGNN